MSSIGSMNISINNNRKLLDSVKRKSIYKSRVSYAKQEMTSRYVLPEVPPHVLRRIRLKIKRQQRRLLIKQLIIGLIVGGVLVYYWFLS